MTDAPALPALREADEPNAVDLFLARPGPHVLAMLVPVLAGIWWSNAALTAGGALLVVLYSNVIVRRRLLALYRKGHYRRFLAMADRIQASFPLPFRPVSNLPELRAIARVKIGEPELGKKIFRTEAPQSLPPAFQGISTYNMAIMFLEMQDPASALEILSSVEDKAALLGDLYPLLRGAQVQAHFARGEMERAAEMLVLARAGELPPSTAVTLTGWEALLALEHGHDPERARELSRAALARAAEVESDQARDWLEANDAFIALGAGDPAVTVLARVTALVPHEERLSPYQRGLVHYVAARCHAKLEAPAEARRELEAARAACRCTWLDGRLDALEKTLSDEA